MKRIGEFYLDAKNHCLRNGQVATTLSAKAVKILEILSTKAGQLVTHDELLDSVWHEIHVQPEVLKVYIFELRRALGDTGQKRKYIETVHRRGYRLLADAADEPEPSAAGKDGRDFFLGRDAELEDIDSHMQLASTGRRQTVFIRGETGIGKSELLRQVLVRAERQPMSWVLRGQCTRHTGETEPFSPILDALDRLIKGDRQHPLAAILRAEAPCWLVQFPNLLDAAEYEALKRDLAGTTSQRMSREFCAALDVACAEQRLVLALDDLQWADPSTVGVVEALAMRDEPACLLILCAYRSGQEQEEMRLRQAVAGLQMRRLCKVINLGPIPEAALKRYINLRFAGGALNEEIGRKICHLSGGVPLFFSSCVDYLQSQLRLLEAPDAWIAARESLRFANSLPETLRELIEIRLSQLGADEQLVLEAASLIGMEFSARLAAAGLDLEHGYVEDVCSRMVRAGNWLLSAGFNETGTTRLSARFRFVHGLLRDALYERQTDAERMKRHLRVARAMEAELGEKADGSASGLAWQFEAGHDYSREIYYLRKAARKAYGMFSEHEAAALLRRALQAASALPEPDKAASEIAILSELGDIYLSSGDFKRSAATWQELASRAMRAQRIEVAAAALLKSAFPFSWAKVESLRSTAREVLRLRPEIQDALARAEITVRALMARAMAGGWRVSDSSECRIALETLTRENDTVEAASARISYAWFQLRESAYREAILGIQEALPTVREAGRFDDVLRAEMGLATALFHMGDWGRMRQVVNSIILSAAKRGNDAVECLFTYLLAWLHLECGASDWAINLCHHAEQLDERSGSVIGPVLGNTIRGLAELGAGSAGDALRRFGDAKEAASGGFDLWFVISEIGVVECLMASGDLAACAAAAETLQGLLYNFPEKTWSALGLRSCARAAAASSEWAKAATYIEQALELVSGADLPLASWRVYETASKVYGAMGQNERAAGWREQAKESVDSLAGSLDADDPLRRRFTDAAADD